MYPDDFRDFWRFLQQAQNDGQTQEYPMAYNDFNLDSHWLPFTPNRHFRKDPRIFVGAVGI
jgi:hypothetical protein